MALDLYPWWFMCLLLLVHNDLLRLLCLYFYGGIVAVCLPWITPILIALIVFEVPVGFICVCIFNKALSKPRVLYTSFIPY